MNPLDQPSTSKGLGSEVHLDEDIQDILEYLYDSGSEIDDEVKDPDYENSASDEIEFEEEEREEIPAKRPRLEVAPVRMLTTCRDTSTAAAGSNVAAGTWRKDDPSPPTPPPFTARPGLNLVGDVSSPFDAFSLFFTENIFKSIKEETNRYARSIIDRESKKGPLKPHGMLAKWKAVSVAQIKLFFCVIIHMSLVKKPGMKDYWSTHGFLKNAFCQSINMPRTLFMRILSMLHLNDNSKYIEYGKPGHDRLFKIRPVLESLIYSFGNAYTPQQNLTIDEVMCPFRGRVGFRVYIKGKPHKYGIKIFQICEAVSGYAYNFDIYTGKDPEQPEHNSIPNLVDRLAKRFYGQGYHIYFDRWFSSPELFDKLWEKKTLAVGTVMPSRKTMPKTEFSQKLKRGEIIKMRRKHLLAIKWKDVRDVFMLSTVHEGERKQTRNSLSLSVKLQILREIEVEKKKKTDVAQKHNIPQSSLSTIIKNSEKIHQQALHAGESSRKRARGSTYADVDEALLQWFKQARSAALPVNGPLLSEKAKTLALEFGLKDFTGSGGWIERWKARHGIKLRNICGESADVNRETMTNWLTDVMPNIISNYACKDIFNADETGLFWRLLPDKTLHFKGETCTGGKASKERITILLCCNMDGSEKMQPLVIGKAKQPRCFRGIKHLPVQYEANQKAWMTRLLFESWVRHIDKKMAGQHRQIILLLDNCGAHPPDMQGLTNTRIAFLPPNTTSMLQPCDQGIIRNFKMIYRTRLMRKYLTAYDAGTALTINLKQAVDIISVAWNDVLPATISNCWHHSGIIKSDVSSPLDTSQPATQMWEQQSLFDRMKEVLKIPLEMDFDSYADADNGVVTKAMLSDVEIVESILQAKEEEETDQVDEEVDPIVHISHPKEVLESIQTLRLFLQCQDESKSLHRHLSDLDNIEKSVQHLLLTSKYQKKITNYFSKNT
ncbi:TIGD4 [Cordylochernes scorpioides]|uniref:TIGD4 n=1 Tax=Cordylochernes scorpioides TaxID=51811 RepID=A0ABY6LTH4_9ARAC|nr:TIGD4 [Cordylochernes scorpioides]